MDKETLLHRQVNPNFVTNDIISSQIFQINIASSVFTPTPKDDGKLSVYNGDKFSAEESLKHFTISFKSVGVVSVSIDDCNTINLKVIEDNFPFDGHSYIDFSTIISKSEIKKLAQKLKNLASKRGWSYKV